MRTFGRLALLAGFSCGLPSLHAASAAVLVTQCGSVISSTVKTFNGPAVNAPDYNFSAIPGATVTVNVPAGASRCIKVRFSAELTTSDAYGFVRAVVDSAALNPQKNDLSILSTNTAQRDTHGFIWIRRVSSGSHNVTMQWRLYTGGATLTLHAWTMEVELTN